MDPIRRKFIGVIGASEAPPEILRLAEQVGKLIAKSGSVLVCGGLGGVMEAAAKGARDQGGLTVGILPGASRKDANQSIDIAIATNMGYARNAIIAHTCDSLIAVSGEYGTLSEIAFGLKLGRKIVSLGSWDIDRRIARAHDAQDAVRMALES